MAPFSCKCDLIFLLLSREIQEDNVISCHQIFSSMASLIWASKLKTLGDIPVFSSTTNGIRSVSVLQRYFISFMVCFCSVVHLNFCLFVCICFGIVALRIVTSLLRTIG